MDADVDGVATLVDDFDHLLEAPFLQEERAGAQRKEFFRDPSWEDFLRMTDGHPEIVSLITLAPERAGSECFIRKAAAAGIHVSIGHTSADAETVHAAADWGADHVTHTFNAQTPVHHRKPGVPGAAISLPTTMFDVLVPQIFVGDKFTKEELVRLGDGGLCQMCKVCHFPNCTFGSY